VSFSRSIYYRAMPIGKTGERFCLVRIREPVSRKRVRRLMRLLGLQAVFQRPRTSQPHPEHKIYPYLLRDLAITRPNQVWCADVERHEALLNLAVVEGHRLWPVAAGRKKLRAA
jgi:transposase InsO family protein